jgi:hypothetical protein
MVDLALYGGPLKREIIKRAFGYCGQSTTEFELSPEEYTQGLQLLNDQMAVLGEASGYNFPVTGDGNPEEESGLAAQDVLGASVYLAQLLAPTIGKALALSDTQKRACSNFLVKCTAIPQMQLGRGTIRGKGARFRRSFGPFFITDISDSEVAQ